MLAIVKGVIFVTGIKIGLKINKMTINPNISRFQGISPLRQLLLSVVIILVAGTGLFSLFLLVGNFIFNGDLALLANSAPETGLNQPWFIMFTLVAQDISFFIIPALIILNLLDPEYKSGILTLRTLRLNDILLVTILAFCVFPVTGLAGQLNSGMTLPDWLSGMEQWMRDKEDYADHLLDVIMTPGTFWGMWLNLIIIAALPAVSEELIFRGVLQRMFHKLFRSGHLSVWVTSFLFSAIHFQFYGFLPRLLLGLIFGYLFLWSRNIWLPIIAHFVNNAVPTVGAYVKGWEAINEPLLATTGKQIAGMIVPLTIAIIILAYFRKRSPEYQQTDPDQPQPHQM
jgi:uncharacterized protein